MPTLTPPQPSLLTHLTLNPALPSNRQALNTPCYFILLSVHTPLPFRPANSGSSFRTLLQHHFFSHILPERLLVKSIFCTPVMLHTYLLDHLSHYSGILVSTSIWPAKQWASQTWCQLLHIPSLEPGTL